MKTTKTILSFLFVLIYSTSILAQQQENQLILTIKHKVKPEKIDEYLKVWEELASACKEHNYPYTYYVWQSTLPDFYFFFPVKDYNSATEISNEMWKIVPKMGSGYGEKLMTTLDSWDQFFLRRNDSISYNPENSAEGLVYAEWWIRYHQTWNGWNYRNTFKQTIEKTNESNAEYPIARFQADIGMNGPAIITVFWGKNPADLYAHRSKNWEDLGDEGQKMINDLKSTTRKIDKIPFWYLKELSYTPE